MITISSKAGNFSSPAAFHHPPLFITRRKKIIAHPVSKPDIPVSKSGQPHLPPFIKPLQINFI